MYRLAATLAPVLVTLFPIVLLSQPPAMAATAGIRGNLPPSPVDPDPPARLLLRRGELHLMDTTRGETASTLAVEIELEIKNAEGREQYRRMSLTEGEGSRLESFSGRTVLPNGEAIPVTEDALFVRPLPGGVGRRTTVVFPQVEVGSTLHYRYEMRFDASFYQGPWYFQSQLETKRSEIVYRIPKSIATRSFKHVGPGQELHRRQTETARGSSLELWMEDLPALVAEPYGPPVLETASQVLLVVAGSAGPGSSFGLDSWPGIRRAALDQYRRARASDGAVRREARELIGQASDDRAESAARALYLFVRDHIETEGRGEIFLPEREGGLDAVLERGRGTVAEKALLLQSMLREGSLESRLVWAAEDSRRRLDLSFPNPLRFRKVLIGVEIGEGERFLDPSDPNLAFGRLAPGTEGGSGLALGAGRLRPLALTSLEAEHNAREMAVELILGEDGRWHGRGRLALLGHAAWETLHRLGPARRLIESLHPLVVDAWPEFDIADLEVERRSEGEEVFAAWTMTERAGRANGSESRLRVGLRLPARLERSLLLPERRSPVRVDFPFEDRIEVTVRWPSQWEIASLPTSSKGSSPVGQWESFYEGGSDSEKADTASLIHRSRLRVSQRQVSLDGYPELLQLLMREEEDREQSLVLTRR